MIKHRLTKKQLTRIVTILTEKLYEKNSLVKNSLVGIETLKNNLQEIQNRMTQSERNHAWNIPMNIDFDNNGNLNLLPNMDYVLILDFDN